MEKDRTGKLGSVSLGYDVWEWRERGKGGGGGGEGERGEGNHGKSWLPGCKKKSLTGVTWERACSTTLT